MSIPSRTSQVERLFSLVKEADPYKYDMDVACQKAEITALVVKDKTLLSEQDPQGRTPLFYARLPQIAARLIHQNADPHHFDKNRETPLMAATSKHLHTGYDHQTAMALLQAGVNFYETDTDSIPIDKALSNAEKLHEGTEGRAETISAINTAIEDDRKFRELPNPSNTSPIAQPEFGTGTDQTARATTHFERNRATYLTVGVALATLSFYAVRAYDCFTRKEEVPVVIPVDDSFYGRYWASPIAPPTLPPTQTFEECFLG